MCKIQHRPVSVAMVNSAALPPLREQMGLAPRECQGKVEMLHAFRDGEMNGVRGWEAPVILAS